MWVNENAGVLVLIGLIIAVVAFSVVITVLVSLHNRIAVQRLKLIGFYSKDAETRENYAVLTIGNKSLNDVGISQLGLKNGRVNFDLTALYKTQMKMNASTRIVIEQRSAITFRMSEKELSVVLIDTPKGKKLSTLKLYAVDLTGNVYQGRVRAVRHLLAEYVKFLKTAPAAVPTPSPAELVHPEEKK